MTNSAGKRRIKHGKILVIEDDPDQRGIIQSVAALVLPNIELISVTNPKQAAAFLEGCLASGQGFPQLILLDLYLPHSKDGWGLLHQIKAMAARISRMPLIILSNSDNQGDITHSYQQGVSAYMVKPSDYEGWRSIFENFNTYWLQTVTLPFADYQPL